MWLRSECKIERIVTDPIGQDDGAAHRETSCRVSDFVGIQGIMEIEQIIVDYQNIHIVQGIASVMFPLPRLSERFLSVFDSLENALEFRLLEHLDIERGFY
jgi:hypothetical protein